MQAYIVKYALTKGIIEVEAKLREDGSIVFDMFDGWVTRYAYKDGKDWFSKKEDAIAKAQEMRKIKLRALHKQISRISSLKF